MNWLKKIVRPEILKLKAYYSVRTEYDSHTQIQLDHNENPDPPYGYEQTLLNRYPEPQPAKLKQKLASLYTVKPEQILITRGMDEGIDVLIKTFCRPYQDTITITPPTFGYYAIAACINANQAVEVRLNEYFLPDWSKLTNIKDTKIIFICNPNNPTGSLISIEEIKTLCSIYDERSIIAVDEAYIEFADIASATTLLEAYPNLVVMRTLSKAYALAGVRIGCVMAHPDIIALLNKIIPPYPIPRPCYEIALASLSPIGLFYADKKIQQIKAQRAYLYQALAQSEDIKKIYPSAANFLLIQAKDAHTLYQTLTAKGIFVRNRTQDIDSALRITIGSPAENKLLLNALNLLPASENIAVRQAHKSRKTKETEILCEATLDNYGTSDISTGIGFFDHMLEQLAKHSGISMIIKAIGDTHIDVHHTVEDVAIVLGQTIKAALGDRTGIRRYAFVLPMDEAQATVSIDLSNRGHCHFDVTFPSPYINNFPTEMVSHFFESFSTHLGAAIHISAIGKNTHHIIEAIFKCTAQALCQAIAVVSTAAPSTKGVL